MIQCPGVPCGAAAASGLGTSRVGGWGLWVVMPTVWAGRVRVTVQTSDCGFLGHRPYFELGVLGNDRGSGLGAGHANAGLSGVHDSVHLTMVRRGAGRR